MNISVKEDEEMLFLQEESLDNGRTREPLHVTMGGRRGPRGVMSDSRRGQRQEEGRTGISACFQ